MSELRSVVTDRATDAEEKQPGSSFKLLLQEGPGNQLVKKF